MALRLSFGQYYQAKSLLHAMDPRAKIVAALVVMISSCVVLTPAQLTLELAFGLIAVALSKVPARKVLSSIAPLTVMLLVLGLFNLFFVSSGTVLARLGPLTITSDGAWYAVCYPLRFAVCVLMGALLLLTTTPAQLTDAFDSLLSPLAKLGLPAHELAMVFSLMLRFIPTLADEAKSIMDAQAARGGAIERGKPLQRLRAVGSVVVALLASAAHHADNLARALDARCYIGGAKRGHWHPLHMEFRDWAALAITLAYVVVLVLIG